MIKLIIKNLPSHSFLSCFGAHDIILLTKRDKSEVVEELNNVLYLDLLQIDERLIFTLAGALRDAYDIVSRYSVYSFSIFDEIYRLPYNV